MLILATVYSVNHCTNSPQKYRGYCFSYTSLAKYLGCSEDVARVCLEAGTTLEQHRQKQEERHWQLRVINGVEHYGTLDMLYKYYSTVESKVKTRMTRQGMTLEQALTTPTQRVNEWIVDGEKLKTKAMCEMLGINSRKFNNYRADGKSVEWLKEYFQINNSISPVV